MNCTDGPNEIIQGLGSSLQNIEGIHTLEVCLAEDPSQSYVYNTEKSTNIADLINFMNNVDSEGNLEAELAQKISESPFIYQGYKYAFNRIAEITEDFCAFMLISSEPIDGMKRGLVLIIDATGVVIIATCGFDKLRKFYFDLSNILYPDSL